ncbi:hypothetical protein OG819_49925 [Streptomyces sp. NBC_01549]|uniref:hypothetical protein n=1 Tax=unclassified Streptomyces TaxID=2593676 RepID=UPI00225C4037|nr:hypothetical protein [Streptomyces sp. NBC_01549]MCX4597410.1 hypothetical protein [Streptomyces sp. NBC_01549]
MTIHIAPEAVLILIVGCVVGVTVFKYTARTHTGVPTRGDLAGAITAAVGVIAALGLLLGLGSDGSSGATSDPTPQPTSSATRSCPGGASQC